MTQTPTSDKAGFWIWVRDVDRYNAWWHRYAGSIAFVSLILVSAVGFWHANRSIERMAAAEREIRAEREARIVAFVEEQTARAKHEAAVAKQIATEQLRAVRQANVDGCARDNQMRERWRVWARAQLAVTRSTGTETAPDLSLAQFFALRDREEAALQRLYSELAPVDCVRAYPPVTPEAGG